MPGDFQFAAGKSRSHAARSVEDFDLRVQGMNRPGTVDHDQIAVFSFEFLHGPHARILGFQGESDHPLSDFSGPQSSDYVGCFDQLQL